MIRSDIFTVPTRTSILNISSPIYAQVIVTGEASVATTGGDVTNRENIRQAKTITAPSRQTA